MSANNVQFFLTMRNQIKLYHWQTGLYSRHKGTDGVIESLDENIDKFVEVYMGKYGRPKMNSRTNTIQIKNFTEKNAVTFVKACIQELIMEVPKGLKKTDTDLLNLRDEMLGDLNQLLYLFTLH
jgi:hypothetical protein